MSKPKKSNTDKQPQDAVGSLTSKARSAAAAGKAALAARGIAGPRDVGPVLAQSYTDLSVVAATIRIGIGLLFIIGGWNKLSKLLSVSGSDKLVASYTSTSGYINEFFMTFLFGPGSSLTPWSFLTLLSSFELVTGIMLVAGLLVRPVALIYAFLLWSFVLALPVVTTNGIDPGVKTYMAPAALVQIRDIALSGFMFVLYGLGSGARSLDLRIFGSAAITPIINWQTAGLLLRLSLAIVFIVGGIFAGMPNIKSFIEPGFVLTLIGLALLWGGAVGRYAAMAACAIILFYVLSKIGYSKGFVGSLNAIKREIALFAVALVISIRGSGSWWTVPDAAQRVIDGIALARAHAATDTPGTDKAA